VPLPSLTFLPASVCANRVWFGLMAFCMIGSINLLFSRVFRCSFVVDICLPMNSRPSSGFEINVIASVCFVVVQVLCIVCL
jgi:hypothetical protein